MKKYMVVFEISTCIGAKFFDSYDNRMRAYLKDCKRMNNGYYEVYERVFDEERRINVYQLSGIGGFGNE